MKSINFVIVGDYQIASELGKKGTTTDLSIYDRKHKILFSPGLCLSLFPIKFNL
jgi:hypothetical protein